MKTATVREAEYPIYIGFRATEEQAKHVTEFANSNGLTLTEAMRRITDDHITMMNSASKSEDEQQTPTGSGTPRE